MRYKQYLINNGLTVRDISKSRKRALKAKGFGTPKTTALYVEYFIYEGNKKTI